MDKKSVGLSLVVDDEVMIQQTTFASREDFKVGDVMTYRNKAYIIEAINVAHGLRELGDIKTIIVLRMKFVKEFDLKNAVVRSMELGEIY